MTDAFIVSPRGEHPTAGRPASEAGRPGTDPPRARHGTTMRGAPTQGAPRRRPIPQHPALADLAVYLADPEVTDVFVNGVDGLFVDRGRGAERIPGWRTDERGARELAVTLIGIGGRHLDDFTPLVDVRWEHGARVHAVLPPVACGGATISIRLPSPARLSLDDLVARGTMDASTAAKLTELIERRVNLLVTGSTGAGKTTLLASLLALVPHGERIVTIEDVAELRIDHPHHVRLEARQANIEGAGAVGLPRLVREALRMRPDRLVVGECRGEEVRELLTALNTGHDGGAGTLHASGLPDVPARLEALGALAGMSESAVARQAASALGAVVHIERGADGIRRVSGIARPVVRGGRLEMEEAP